MTKNHMLRILSLGAGVQSSTVAMMAKHGEIEPFDAAIFADTGWEPKAVYNWLDWLEKQLPFPVYRVNKGNLKVDLREGCGAEKKRFASVPFFTSGGGIGKRQCSQEYKITPIRKKIRELAGLKPRQRAKEILATEAVGISLDEIQRMKPPRVWWLEGEWPLIDLRMTRADCLQWMQSNGYPEPPKSACIGCPFHNDQMWRSMRDNDTAEFQDAVDMDNVIRTGGKTQREHQFMHRSLKPLGECEFKGDSQIDMFGNECSGLCGT